MVPAAFSELMTQFERLVQTNCCGLFAGLPADHWSWVSGEPPGETQQHHPLSFLKGQQQTTPRQLQTLDVSVSDYKGMVMMGSRCKTPRNDGNKATQTWLVCQSWAQAPGCGDPSLSSRRQTLIWPTDLLSHIDIHDTFQMNRDKAPFYITQSGQIPTITSMWSNSKSQSILALPRTPWTPPTSYLHPDLTKEKDGVRVCSLRICPGSQGRHGIHSQSHLVSFTPLRAEW